MRAEYANNLDGGAGHGFLVLTDLPDDPGAAPRLTFSLQRSSDRRYLGAAGWLIMQEFLAPASAENRPEGLRLAVGPAVVDQLAMDQTYRLVVKMTSGRQFGAVLRITAKDAGIIYSDASLPRPQPPIAPEETAQPVPRPVPAATQASVPVPAPVARPEPVAPRPVQREIGLPGQTRGRELTLRNEDLSRTKPVRANRPTRPRATSRPADKAPSFIFVQGEPAPDRPAERPTRPFRDHTFWVKVAAIAMLFFFFILPIYFFVWR